MNELLIRLAVIQRELYELKHNESFTFEQQGLLNVAENNICFAVYDIQKQLGQPIGVDKVDNKLHY